MNPIVSVIISTFNRAKYVGQFVRRVFVQTFADYQDIGGGRRLNGQYERNIGPFQVRRIFRYHYQLNSRRSTGRNHGLTLA